MSDEPKPIDDEPFLSVLIKAVIFEGATTLAREGVAAVVEVWKDRRLKEAQPLEDALDDHRPDKTI